MFVLYSVLMPNLLGVNQVVPRTLNLPDAGFLNFCLRPFMSRFWLKMNLFPINMTA